MNIKRLTVLRDFLRSPPEDRTVGFNMIGWQENKSDGYKDLLGESANLCGTVCCIAGLASTLWPEVSSHLHDSDKATEILDLDAYQATDLFHGGKYELDAITVDMAIEALSSLISTGTVEWSDSDER